jgi:RNA polymerase sigma-70 factor (ECF subfamily)
LKQDLAWSKPQVTTGQTRRHKLVEPALAVLSDEALMARIGQGDTSAYQTLVERHLGPCTGLATRVLFHGNDAEEVMQEAFLRLWRHAPSWKPEGAKFTTWFYRVIMNLCIDHQRKTNRRPKAAFTLGSGTDEANELEERLADKAPGADELIARNETKTEVQRAIKALPERQKMAISLCYLQELSNREAADIMDINIKALESLLSRGRKRLATQLEALKSPRRQQ